MRCATRWARVLVFPVPAPAMIRSGVWSGAVAAARCCGFRVERKGASMLVVVARSFGRCWGCCNRREVRINAGGELNARRRYIGATRLEEFRMIRFGMMMACATLLVAPLAGAAEAKLENQAWLNLWPGKAPGALGDSPEDTPA